MTIGHSTSEANGILHAMTPLHGGAASGLKSMTDLHLAYYHPINAGTNV